MIRGIRLAALAGILTSAMITANAAMARTMRSETFVTKAATAGMAEVSLGQLALDRSSNEDVKRFAQQMIDDHGAAGAELKQLATEDHLAVPDAPTPVQKAAGDSLGRQAGAAFDRRYATQMVKDHEEAVALFRKASTDTKLRPNLRTFAQKTLPTLEHHLEEAKQLQGTVAHASK